MGFRGGTQPFPLGRRSLLAWHRSVLTAGAIALITTASLMQTASSGAASSPSSPGTTSSAATKKGVIDVGSISTRSGIEAADFDAFVPGIEAYFRMVDAEGGVDGHQIVLSQNLDDGSNPAEFDPLAETLIEQDHVFAVFTSTLAFAPSLFTSAGIPTYGYDITGNWAGFRNLFAVGGSILDYHVLAPAVAALLKLNRAHSVAVISYGPAIPASYQACDTLARDLRRGGITVGVDDLDAQYGGDLSPAAQQMAVHRSDFVVSCMGGSDNIDLSRALQQYRIRPHQLWFNGYDQSMLDKYRGLMQGVYIDTNGFVPFNAPASFPGSYPGMAKYLATMRRYAPSDVTSELAVEGWQSAALFVEGLRRAGADLSPRGVVTATNRLKDFTSAGVSAPINWTTAHSSQSFPVCSAFVVVRDATFEPVASSGHRVFFCFPQHTDLKNPIQVTAPTGTPGG